MLLATVKSVNVTKNEGSTGWLGSPRQVRGRNYDTQFGILPAKLSGSFLRFRSGREYAEDRTSAAGHRGGERSRFLDHRESLPNLRPSRNRRWYKIVYEQGRRDFAGKNPAQIVLRCDATPANRLECPKYLRRRHFDRRDRDHEREIRFPIERRDSLADPADAGRNRIQKERHVGAELQRDFGEAVGRVYAK